MSTTDSIASCCLCKCACSHDNAIMLEGQWVCAQCKPRYLDMLKNGTRPSKGANSATPQELLLARDGNLLVMGRKAQLPDRCVKCNEPACGAKLTRKLTCFSPWWYLLLLVNLLICAIVIMCIQKKATVEIGLCEKHRSQRSKAIAIGWVGFGLFVVSIIAAVVAANGLIFAAGVVVVLASAIYSMVAGGTVTAVKIDPQIVRLKGVCPAFLDQLPRY